MGAPFLDRVARARERLRHVGQEHVLALVERVTPAQAEELLAQVEALDLARLPGLIDRYVHRRAGADGAHAPTSQRIEPVEALEPGVNVDGEKYRAIGEDLIRRGKVAAFTVAGGQGTRLGFDGPKGCYPAGSVTGKPLFACLAEWILGAQRRYGGANGGLVIPWYIMTSPLNHEATVAFFAQNGHFGLRAADVMFFRQGVMPSFDKQTGKLLLDQPHALALSPDGHGGALRALATSGALADMERRGIEQLSYTQIDNPLVRVIDPLFIGLHASAPGSSGQMSSKMVPKAGPGEKVGVLCRVVGADGRARTQVIEYSDMPKELTEAREADGRLRFDAGSIAIHVISVRFLRELTGPGGALDSGLLAYHRAEKKVPFVDLATGQRVEPASPNAVKLELFVFDALALCERSIVLKTDRVEEFAPIKNAEGSDSPATCAQIQTLRAARWLQRAGVGGVGGVPVGPGGEPDCVLELSPLVALEPADLRGRTVSIARGARVAL
jgi:UDP-N-acetylglucosamine/UDP-N-acetylgalactosamine diphosphorylase